MRALLADVIPSSCVDGPGNRFVVFLQGCGFDCLACHNPQTICTRATPSSHWASVEEVLADVVAAAPFLSGVTVSGGEATLQWEFVAEFFARLRTTAAAAHLTRLVDTNGDAEPFVWSRLGPLMDGAMVDLKALDGDVHRFLTGRDNERVLASLRQLDAMRLLTEVRLLIVPEVNDSVDQIARTATWLSRLASAPPVRVLGFRHAGTRRVADRFREATQDDVDRVTESLIAGGVAVRTQVT